MRLKQECPTALSLCAAIALASTIALPSSVSLAAETDTPPTDSSQLAEVVVTAQKSAEPLSRIPISLTAVSGSELKDQQITDYSDLARAVPNLSFSSGGGPGQNNIEIRGVSSQAGSATTGIYLDDVPINVLNIYTTGATEPRFFDIDRVEVLRGPQGTLYGAGSMGGTLHFVSNQPDLHNVSGTVHSMVSGTEYGGLNYEGDSVVNLPLVDGTAALRIGALYDHESGYINRVTPDGATVATHINDQDTTVIRATLEWRPIEGLTVTPAVFLQRMDTGGQDTFGLAEPEFQSPTLVREAARDESAITSLTLKYDMGWSELTSVSGYFWRDDNRLIDGTQYDSAYIGASLQDEFGYGGAAIAGLAAPAQFETNINQLHQEIRLASKPAGPDDKWSWIAGLYYSRTRTGLLDNEHIPGFNSTFEATYDDTPLDVLGAAFPNDLVYYAFTEFVNTEKAVFGQATYSITPQLKVTAGARYEKASEDLSFTSAGYFSSGDGPFYSSATGSKTTPKGVISYDVSESTMVYASAAEGFRIGGINRPVPVPLCSGDLAGLGLTQAPNAYKSDSLWSYEVGAKTRALQNTLSVSGSVFDIRWNNIQTDIILPTCTFDIKDNIGSAESRGVELEVTQRLLDRVTLTVGGNYTSAKITVPVTLLGVEKGDRVPGVPDYSFSSAVEYDQPFAGAYHGTLRANAQWIGPSQGTILHGDPDFDRPAYFTMGTSAGLRWDNIDVNLFITNLLDQHKAIQRPNIADVEYGITVRPRTYGIGGTYSFLTDSTHSTTPVPLDQSVSAFRVSLVMVGIAFTLTGLYTGSELAADLGLDAGIRASVLGGIVLTLMSVPAAVVGARTRLSTYVIVSRVFGAGGSKVINLVLAIVLLGWYAVTAELFGRTCALTAAPYLPFALPTWSYTLASSALVIATTAFGFQAINRLSLFAAPLLVALTAYVAWRALAHAPWSRLETIPGAHVDLATGVSAVIGGWIVNVVLMPDVTRYSRSTTECAVISFVGNGIGAVVALVLAMIPALAFGEIDPMKYMAALGVVAVAFTVLVISTWTINAVNLYSTGLVTSTAFPRVSYGRLVVASGVVGTIAALVGVADRLIDFLVLLGLVVPPIAAVYLTDYFILCRRDYGGEADSMTNIDALIACFTGAAMGIVMYYTHSSLTGVPTIESFVTAGMVYWLTEYVRRAGERDRQWRRRSAPAS